RLLWALGFGAAISTPVKVICVACPPDPWNQPQPIQGKTIFKEAVIQELKRGKEITIQGEAEVGWSWKKDLPLVSNAPAGATRAQIDAPKLIAVLVQQGDSKSAQQKLICRPEDYDPNRTRFHRDRRRAGALYRNGSVSIRRFSFPSRGRRISFWRVSAN